MINKKMIAQKTFKDEAGEDVDVTLYLLRAFRGLFLARQLGKVLLPVLGSFMAPTEEDEDPSVDFSRVAETLVESIDSIDVESLVKELLDGITIDGIEVDLDEYFMANYGLLLEIVAFSLQENFQSFFTSSLSGKMPLPLADTTKKS